VRSVDDVVANTRQLASNVAGWCLVDCRIVSLCQVLA
jgi:hypothetical protein